MLWACLIFFACEDDTISRIGLGIQPEEDDIAVYDTTIHISAATVKTDSVYAKTINGYLGEFYDPEYGTIRAGYASQFYPSFGFSTSDMTTGKIDSVRLDLYYSYFAGDPHAPMEVTIYPLNKPLEKHYYTNLDPATFCDVDNPVVRYGYMAANPLVSDSLISAGHYRMISIRLPNELGEKFLEEYKKPEPNAFSSAEAFTKFFPGFYLENSFGKGSVISVERTQLRMYYERTYETTSSQTGNDTVYQITDYSNFDVTKEVVQMNAIESGNDDFLLQPNNEKAFIKAPNGVFTQISIPIKEIRENMENRKFSGVSLSLRALEQKDWIYSLGFPGRGIIGNPSTSTTAAKLLLIEPDSVKNFFESKRVADNYTSFSTVFDVTTYSYTFNNISNLIQNVLDKDPEKEVLNLLLIPVQTTFIYQQSSYYSQGIPVDYATSYYLFPSAVALKKDKENLKIRILASSLEKK